MKQYNPAQTKPSHKTTLLGGLITTLLLSACGGGGGGGSGPSDPGVTPRTANAVAAAGEDQDVTRGFTVTLDASASTDPDGDTLTYTWTQVAGPDVTAGSGTLSGVNPSFPAPEQVSTLRFQLTVNDGAGDSDPDDVQIMVLEDANVALFVDGDNGDDTTGDGSRAHPFATIAHALTALSPNLEDIYVMRRGNDARYDESSTTLVLPAGTSLYGGYGPDWLRDPQAMPTRLLGNATALRFSAVNFDAWLSGFDITTTDSPDAATPNRGVIADNGTATLTLRNNIIATGDVAAGTATQPGSNYGLYVANLPQVLVADNIISTGQAGHGAVGIDGDPGVIGSSGARASGSGRASGGSGNPGHNGGAGGERGGGPGGNGGGGGKGGGAGGGAGGSAGSGVIVGNGNDGSPGKAGAPGGTGGPGKGGTGYGTMDAGGFLPGNGGRGNSGGVGYGGGGGGGGEASSGSWVGGGGGGGGEGGSGGQGGAGGGGGAASIGLWLANVATASVVNNTINTGIGGDGASGGAGGQGGAGGAGGRGQGGDGGCFFPGYCGGDGGNGGRGGNGGAGGQGGGGGGGPSFGIFIGPNLAPDLRDNNVISGVGGNGGDGPNPGNGGWSYAVFDADLNDGMVPVLVGNTLEGGRGGTAGTGGTAADGESGRKNF